MAWYWVGQWLGGLTHRHICHINNFLIDSLVLKNAYSPLAKRFSAVRIDPH